MNAIAVIVAGGSGKRLGGAVPKQFQLLQGKPVLMHTLAVFAGIKDFQQIRLVLPETFIALWTQLCKEYSFEICHQVIAGGTERFFSVKNALEEIPDDCLIAIHDGVRPLVSAELISRGLHLAAQRGAAIPVISVTESLRKLTTKMSTPVDRDNYQIVQTPQIFKSEILREAYNQPYQHCFTDDASVVELAGYPIALFEGEKTNLKITTTDDIILAEALFQILQNKRR